MSFTLCCTHIDQSRIYPNRQKRPIGSNAVFECFSHQPWLALWTFNGGRLPSNADMSSNRPGILVVWNVSLSSEGVYECRGVLESKREGGHSQFVAAGILNVTGYCKCLLVHTLLLYDSFFHFQNDIS